jgi:hypothetical protein
MESKFLQCLGVATWREVIILFGFFMVYSTWETWLGKTDKVKAGSTFELIWHGIKALFTKKQNPGGNDGKTV